MRWRRWILVGVVVAVALGAGAGAWWWLRPRGPNVLFITLDTTRADRLKCYGYQKARTPYLDRVAAEGVQFDNAITHVPLTLPSHATMMTGLLPPEHGLRTNAMGSLPTSIPTLAEHFKEHGYRTGAFVGAFVLDHQFGLDRGFDKYDDDLSGGDTPDERNLARRRKAGRVIDSALSWLLPKKRQPFFCWLHFYDPHDPRAEHQDLFQKEFTGRGYDAEIAYVDHELERLKSRLEEAGLLENTIVIIVGDHGESLDERDQPQHEEPEHGKQLYQSTLRVPLLMQAPAKFKFKAGHHVATTVGLNDLFPTIADCLDWKEVRVPSKVAGRSLKPGLEGGRLDEVPHYCETWEPFFAMHCMPQFGLVYDGWKQIRSPQPELYQFLKDPEEATNLEAGQQAKYLELDAILKDLESRFETRTPELAKADPEMDKKLAGIGYARSAGKLPQKQIEGRLKDVKELIRAYRATHEALENSEKDPAGAIAILERVARESPDLHPARTILASLLISKSRDKELDEAKRKGLLEQAEKLCSQVILDEQSWPEDERSWEPYAYLASIQGSRGQYAEAYKNFELATKLQPMNANLFLEWGRLLLRQKQTEKAEEKLDLAVRADEGLFTAQTEYGQLLMERAQRKSASPRAEDRAEEQELLNRALKHFELATKYNREYLPAHYFAAGILMTRKQFAAAADHYATIVEFDKQNAKQQNVKQNAEPLYLWAVALANQDQRKLAAVKLREALAIDPGHAKARDLLRICED